MPADNRGPARRAVRRDERMKGVVGLREQRDRDPKIRRRSTPRGYSRGIPHALDINPEGTPRDVAHHRSNRSADRRRGSAAGQPPPTAPPPTERIAVSHAPPSRHVDLRRPLQFEGRRPYTGTGSRATWDHAHDVRPAATTQCSMYSETKVSAASRSARATVHSRPIPCPQGRHGRLRRQHRHRPPVSRQPRAVVLLVQGQQVAEPIVNRTGFTGDCFV